MSEYMQSVEGKPKVKFPEPPLRPVLVSSIYGPLLFGYLPAPIEPDSRRYCLLTSVKRIVYCGEDVIPEDIASLGPHHTTILSEEFPRAVVYDVTMILQVTPEAERYLTGKAVKEKIQ